ncbi:MAG: GNAT family N-acetyltransferase [Pseudomonadota bacterium]
MTIAIRPAAPKDAGDIDLLLHQCFPRPAEAVLVKQLAIDGDLVLVLLARDEITNELTGMVALSRMDVEVGGEQVPAVALAPVAVAPGFRRTGVADVLIQAAIHWMRDAGAALMFVLGEPGFYGRFGFSTELAEGYESPYAGPFLMAAAVQGVAPEGARGRAEHAPAFAALSEDA